MNVFSDLFREIELQIDYVYSLKRTIMLPRFSYYQNFMHPVRELTNFMRDFDVLLLEDISGGYVAISPLCRDVTNKGTHCQK